MQKVRNGFGRWTELGTQGQILYVAELPNGFTLSFGLLVRSQIKMTITFTQLQCSI